MSSTAALSKRRTNGKASSAVPLQEFIDTNAQVVSLTVQQFHRMIRDGTLLEGAPIELLDGVLVRKDRSKLGDDPMTVGPDHLWVIEELEALKPRLKRLNCYLRVQAPVTLPPRTEPEPDGAIYRGKREDYRGRHPGPKEMLCAIEVADSSLRHDRTTKQRIYADFGIPQYVLINLPERVIEVYTEPLVGEGRYEKVTILRPTQRLTFNTGGKKAFTVTVRSLLP